MFYLSLDYSKINHSLCHFPFNKGSCSFVPLGKGRFSKMYLIRQVLSVHKPSLEVLAILPFCRDILQSTPIEHIDRPCLSRFFIQNINLLSWSTSFLPTHGTFWISMVDLRNIWFIVGNLVSSSSRPPKRGNVNHIK